MPPTLHPEVIEMINLAAQRYGFQILEYTAKKSWSALQRMLAQPASAEPTRRRAFPCPEHEADILEITREEFEQALRELVSE